MKKFRYMIITGMLLASIGLVVEKSQKMILRTKKSIRMTFSR